MLFQACIIDECERLVFDYILTSSGEVEGWTFLDAWGFRKFLRKKLWRSSFFWGDMWWTNKKVRWRLRTSGWQTSISMSKTFLMDFVTQQKPETDLGKVFIAISIFFDLTFNGDSEKSLGKGQLDVKMRDAKRKWASSNWVEQAFEYYFIDITYLDLLNLICTGFWGGTNLGQTFTDLLLGLFNS